jgi:hypothetical protein
MKINIDKDIFMSKILTSSEFLSFILFMLSIVTDVFVHLLLRIDLRSRKNFFEKFKNPYTDIVKSSILVII